VPRWKAPFLRQRQVRLRGFPLCRLGDRCNELGVAAGIDDLLSRLTLVIKFPMSLGIVVQSVEDGAFKEMVVHTCGTRHTRFLSIGECRVGSILKYWSRIRNHYVAGQSWVVGLYA